MINNIDENGYLRLVGRIKEMILRGGENISPLEIEETLVSHAAVSEAVVFGIADERTGEAPVAAVELHARVPVSEEELEQLVARSLATYKRLRRVVIVDEIPRLPSGKVLRRTLRDEWTPKLVGS